MPRLHQLAGLRHSLDDLEAKATRMPGYGRLAIQDQIDRLKLEIAHLEAPRPRPFLERAAPPSPREPAIWLAARRA